MKKITLEVPNSTAQKWQRASSKLKQQAADAIEGMLSVNKSQDEVDETPADAALADALRFYDSIHIDLSGFKFDRDEANER